MAIREGRWDCQYCGAIGNLGRHRQCHNCNHSRPAGTRFYQADDAELADKRLERQALVGPDWICQFCGTSNAGDIHVCGSCGAPRDETTQDQQVIDYGVGEAPTSGDMTFDEEPVEVSPGTAKSSSKLPLLAILAIGAVLVLCLGIVAFLIFGGSKTEVTVAGFDWQRTVDIEAFQTVTEEDWSLPTGGRLISQREEIHHYDQVVDHYETRQREVSEQVRVGVESYVCGQRDLGNGFFEDIECERDIYETQTHTENYEEPIYVSLPVYKTLFVYDIDKWLVIRTETSSGRDHSPSWPRVNLESDEREGGKTETYSMRFVDDEGKIYEWETELNRWQGFEQGQAVVLKLNALGDISDVELP